MYGWYFIRKKYGVTHREKVIFSEFVSTGKNKHKMLAPVSQTSYVKYIKDVIS